MLAGGLLRVSYDYCLHEMRDERTLRRSKAQEIESSGSRSEDKGQHMCFL